MCVNVCVCVCERERAYVCMCVCACVYVCVCMTYLLLHCSPLVLRDTVWDVLHRQRPSDQETGRGSQSTVEAVAEGAEHRHDEEEKHRTHDQICDTDRKSLQNVPEEGGRSHAPSDQEQLFAEHALAELRFPSDTGPKSRLEIG
jgi:hypothetical protein